MAAARGFAYEAAVQLGDGVDPRSPGGAVTAALCGSWEHDPPCRWPHHTSIDTSVVPARLVTIYAVPPEEEAEVLRRITSALRSDPRWTVVCDGTRPLSGTERRHADRLAAPVDGTGDGS